MSAFVGYALGFGLKVLDACGVLKRANQKRNETTSAVDDSPKVKLVCNPAIRSVLCVLCVCVLCMWVGGGWVNGRVKFNSHACVVRVCVCAFCSHYVFYTLAER